MTSLFKIWDQLVDCICRPPRDEYEEEELKGGRRGIFAIGHRRFKRVDFWLTNCRNERIRCSHWLPDSFDADSGKIPVVIYCHCNSGSRRDSEEALFTLLPSGISVFAMDFAGSGQSDGTWVTLGAKEVDDLAAVVQFLRSQSFVTTIGLWGRSMGAVTSLMYAQRDPSIAGMVLDSPFSKLTDLMVEIVGNQRINIPRGLLKIAIAMMRRSVRKRAGFDISKVSPIDFAHETFIPVLFSHAVEDDFVPKHHSERLHEKYGGDKNYVTFQGDHNTRRPPFFYSSVSIFFHNTLSRAEAIASEDLQRCRRSACPSTTGVQQALLSGVHQGPIPSSQSMESSPVSSVLRPPLPAGVESAPPGRDRGTRGSREGDSDRMAQTSGIERYQDMRGDFDMPPPTARRHDHMPVLDVTGRDVQAATERSEGGTRTDGVGSMGALSSDWDAGGLAVEDEEVMLARAIEESLKCQE